MRNRPSEVQVDFHLGQIQQPRNPGASALRMRLSEKLDNTETSISPSGQAFIPSHCLRRACGVVTPRSKSVKQAFETRKRISTSG